MNPIFFKKPTNIFKDVISRYGEKYVVDGVWTTDAPYRETRRKMRLFIDMGVLCVDMEAASLFTISRYRDVEVGALFYAGDLVGRGGI